MGLGAGSKEQRAKITQNPPSPPCSKGGIGGIRVVGGQHTKRFTLAEKRKMK